MSNNDQLIRDLCGWAIETVLEGTVLICLIMLVIAAS